MPHAVVLSALVSNSAGPELQSRTGHQQCFEAVRTSGHFCQTNGGMTLSNLQRYSSLSYQISIHLILGGYVTETFE